MSEDLNTIIGEKNSVGSGALLTNKGILVVLSELGFGKTYILDNRVTVAGRGTQADFIINDPLISKEHMRISVDTDGKYYLEDIDSTNGTFLNGKKISKKTRIMYSDRIVAGNTILRFFHEEKL